MNQVPQVDVFHAPKDFESFFEEIEAIYMLDQPSSHRPERREAARVHVTMPVHINLLNDNFDLIEGTAEGVTRDLSPLGVGFVTLDPIGRKFVLLQLSPIKGEPLISVARVIYEKEVGFYYQYGCQFITPDNEHFGV